MSKLLLPIEPKPMSTWGKTLANRLDKNKWADIRQDVYRRADYTCKICKSKSRNLHCHEVWKFDMKRGIVYLVDLECLCQLCHDVKHFGRSKLVYSKAYVNELVKHWLQINKKTIEDFYVYEQKIFELNKKRANIYWVVKVGKGIII